MGFIIGLAAAMALVGAAMFSPATASPLAPPECAGMTFDNVIYKPNQTAVVFGTEGNDLIVVGEGVIIGNGGDDCIVSTSPSDEAQNVLLGGDGNDVIIAAGTYHNVLAGGGGDDVLISSGSYQNVVSGDADIDLFTGEMVFIPGFDRCIGDFAEMDSCEATD